MDTTNILKSFFKAENERDWATYRKHISHDVVWELHSQGFRRIVGIEEYLETVIQAYEGNNNTFVLESIFSSSDAARVVAILRNSLGEKSCDIFEFDKGLIVKEYEFLLG